MRLCVLLLITACAGEAIPKAGGDEQSGWNKLPKGSRLELPNGLTVLLQENHASPVVALQA